MVTYWDVTPCLVLAICDSFGKNKGKNFQPLSPSHDWQGFGPHGEERQSLVSPSLPRTPRSSSRGSRHMDVDVCKHFRSLLPLWVLGEHQIELLLIEKSPFFWVLERTNILVVNNINFWGFQSIPTNLFQSPCCIKPPVGSLELAHCHFCLIRNKIWPSPMSRWKHILHPWWEELATSLGKGNAYREGWIIKDNDAISQEGETRERPAP